MPSRHIILKRLRAAQQPFTDVEPIDNKKHVVTVDDTSPEALRERFIAAAERVYMKIYQVDSASDGVETVIDLVGEQKQVLSWDEEHIPLPNLHASLKEAGIEVAEPRDDKVLVGITGVDVGLAATGSLVVSSGTGKYRATSLLPDKHIAVVKTSQLTVDLETWVAAARDGFATPSNTVIITGPSKTADIAQELILGAHGPREIHIVLLPD